MTRGIVFFVMVLFLGCAENKNSEVPLIGFLDFVKDPTIQLAHNGFMDALAENGFSENKGTLKVIYRNAQGDINTLGQSCDYMISQDVRLIASNVTLSTITAIKRTNQVPVFMMVSPRLDLANLTDKKGMPPPNLSGVFETLDYIDSSAAIVMHLMPSVKKVGAVYNQAEPQSVAAFERIQSVFNSQGVELISLPVNNSSETQLVTESLIHRGIEAFFALPDNVIFASFETIASSCRKAGIPVFTSESGLVARGALVSFGADFYQWGYQSGLLASRFLKGESMKSLPAESVISRKKVYNPAEGILFGFEFDSTFHPVKE
jgi:putative tryptophan/tyrosine transport system substrate-binding protein